MTSQKALNITINLPQDLQDMGYKELIIKRENGILKTDDDTIILFPFFLDNYDKSMKKLDESLEARSIDERIRTIVCSKLTDVIARYDFDGSSGSDSSGGNNSSSPTFAHEETKIILDEISILVERYRDLPYAVWHDEAASYHYYWPCSTASSRDTVVWRIYTISHACMHDDNKWLFIPRLS